MGNEEKLESIVKRLDSHAQDIHDLKNICQSLAISGAQCTEQIGIMQKIVYGASAIAIAQALALILRK